MSAACHPSMRTWERFSVLLLHTCPEGLGLGLLVAGRGCWPQVRGARGRGCSGSGPRGLCLPEARPQRERHSRGRCGYRRGPRSGAGSAATPTSWPGCPAAAAPLALTSPRGRGAHCGAWETARHQFPEVFLYKIILILKSVCLRMKRLPVACLGVRPVAGAVLWRRPAEPCSRAGSFGLCRSC